MLSTCAPMYSPASFTNSWNHPHAFWHLSTSPSCGVLGTSSVSAGSMRLRTGKMPVATSWHQFFHVYRSLVISWHYAFQPSRSFITASRCFFALIFKTTNRTCCSDAILRQTMVGNKNEQRGLENLLFSFSVILVVWSRSCDWSCANFLLSSFRRSHSMTARLFSSQRRTTSASKPALQLLLPAIQQHLSCTRCDKATTYLFFPALCY